jgi:hypothetical protein
MRVASPLDAALDSPIDVHAKFFKMEGLLRRLTRNP